MIKKILIILFIFSKNNIFSCNKGRCCNNKKKNNLKNEINESNLILFMKRKIPKK